LEEVKTMANVPSKLFGESADLLTSLFRNE
jgi:hypothetical protein